MSIALGIDLGTQSVEVVFYDFLAGELVGVESAPLDIYQTDSGIAEQKAHWWISALENALNKVEKDLRRKVVAIGVSGQQHGFVPLNQSGEVLHQLNCGATHQRILNVPQ